MNFIYYTYLVMTAAKIDKMFKNIFFSKISTKNSLLQCCNVKWNSCKSKNNYRFQIRKLLAICHRIKTGCKNRALQLIYILYCGCQACAIFTAGPQHVLSVCFCPFPLWKLYTFTAAFCAQPLIELVNRTRIPEFINENTASRALCMLKLILLFRKKLLFLISKLTIYWCLKLFRVIMLNKML